MTSQNLKKLSQEKCLPEKSSADLTKAQERNKKNVCKLSNKKLWENHIAEKQKPEKKCSISQSRDSLIRKYLYLVNWVVSRLPVTSLQGMEREDLNSYGIIGLIEAVDRFDPGRNSNFESFAITRIRGSIYDQLRISDWLTRGSRKKVKNLLKASNNLEVKLNRYPTDKELAEELSISLEELRAIQQEAQISTFSLDEPRDNSSDEGISLVETVSSNSTPLLEILEDDELKERLTKAIDTLPEKEKTVIGLYHYKKFTFREIAEVMDFSESRASQIHARAISLLKAKMLKD